MKSIFDVIVIVICVIIFIALLPKLWDRNRDFAGNLIQAGFATMFIVGGAFLLLAFLSDHWLISSLVIGVITYLASGQKADLAFGATILSAILLFIGSYFVDSAKPTPYPDRQQKIERQQEPERQRQTRKEREREVQERDDDFLREQAQEDIRERKNNSDNESQLPSGNWIKDNTNDIYLQNPHPSEGESIFWSGGFVQNGKYRYADGFGTATWYKNGVIIQVDEGNFKVGKRHGRFKQTFYPSGEVIYSDWENGKKLN